MLLRRRLGIVLTLALTGCAGAAPRPMQQALVFADAGQTDRAIALLEEALAKSPRSTDERRLLVRLYGASGDLGAAQAHARTLARQLGPTSPTPWIELGHALELAHRYEQALHEYDRAARVAPTNSAGPRTGGLRAAAWGELDLTEPRLVEALRRDSRDARTWHALGVVRAKRGDLVGAEAAYREGIRLDPASMSNRVGLATLALLRGDAQQVLVEYEQILRMNPAFADAHLGRSWALVRLRRFSEAGEALERAERLGADRGTLARQRQWLANEAKSATSP